MFKSVVAVLAFGLALVTIPVHAETPVAPALPSFDIIDCQTHDALQEDKDHDLAATALKVMGTGDLARLDKMQPDLQAALDRAPDRPSKPEHCGDTVVLYSDDISDMLLLSAAVMKIDALKGVTVLQRGALPYGSLGFIVGWIAYEHKDFAAAAKAYRKGLLNDPDNAGITSELSGTLCNLGHADEGLAVVNDFLAGHGDLRDFDHALLLRKRGYALVELGRLDEGEAAYKESLIYAPGNATAQGELQYIQQQRAKSPKT